jgi:hypothetical protein
MDFDVISTIHHKCIIRFEAISASYDAWAKRALKHNNHQNMASIGGYVSDLCPPWSMCPIKTPSMPIYGVLGHPILYLFLHSHMLCIFCQTILLVTKWVLKFRMELISSGIRHISTITTKKVFHFSIKGLVSLLILLVLLVLQAFWLTFLQHEHKMIHTLRMNKGT